MLEFITSKFQNLRRKLFEAEFDCLHMGNVTTSASEGYHRGLKKAALGPTSNDDVCIAAKKIIDLANLMEHGYWCVLVVCCCVCLCLFVFVCVCFCLCVCV